MNSERKNSCIYSNSDEAVLPFVQSDVILKLNRIHNKLRHGFAVLGPRREDAKKIAKHFK